MKSDWQSNIGTYFAENKIYRVKYLNEKLVVYCKEYVDYLNEFYGVKAIRSDDNNSMYHPDIGNSPIFKFIISVNIRTKKDEFEGFKIQCFYNTEGHLCLESATGLDYMKGLNSKGDYARYRTEVFDEPEILEKEYIFQLINQRLMNFIEKLKKDQGK